MGSRPNRDATKRKVLPVAGCARGGGRERQQRRCCRPWRRSAGPQSDAGRAKVRTPRLAASTEQPASEPMARDDVMRKREEAAISSYCPCQAALTRVGDPAVHCHTSTPRLIGQRNVKPYHTRRPPTLGSKRAWGESRAMFVTYAKVMFVCWRMCVYFHHAMASRS